jgi:hypothetical protein
MAEDDSEPMGAGPTAGAPVNRDAKREAAIIDGEAIRSDEEERATEAKAAASEPLSPPPPPREPPVQTRRPSRFGAFVAGAIGGAIVAALALAGYSTLSPKAGLSEEDASRIAALEATAQKDDAAVVGLGKRLGTLESANAALAPKVSAAAQSAEALSAEVKKLGAVTPSAPADPALDERLKKLESAGLSAAATADLGPLAARIDKLEAALEAQKSAPKTETRIAPEAPRASGDRSADIAIVAEALHDKLVAGAAFPQELMALQSLGVDPGKLGALKAAADGTPTGPALASAFAEIAPEVLAQSEPVSGGSVADRFVSHLKGLVVVHDLHEQAGDNPDALVSQVEALSRRGDVAGALAAFGKLPEASRKVAAAWAAQAGQTAGAAQALQAIREEAIGHLTAGGKP